MLSKTTVAESYFTTLLSAINYRIVIFVLCIKKQEMVNTEERVEALAIVGGFPSRFGQPFKMVLSLWKL